MTRFSIAIAVMFAVVFTVFAATLTVKVVTLRHDVHQLQVQYSHRQAPSPATPVTKGSRP